MIVGIIRRSTEKGVKEPSIERQKESIIKLRDSLGLKTLGVRWIIDICSGDDPDGRAEFQEWIHNEALLEATTHALCESVDRWFRSWHGLMYFEKYLTPNQVQLHLGDVPNMYDQEGSLLPEPYFIFSLQHIIANYFLIQNRQRQRTAIDRILKDPKLRKDTYRGRKKGAKGRKKI